MALVLPGLFIGQQIGSATAGSIPFVDANKQFQQDNANLFWDATNKRLGVGTSSTTFGVNGSTFATKAAILATDNESVTNALQAYSNSVTGTSYFLRSRGSPSSKTIVQSGDVLGAFGAFGYNGTDFTQAAAISFIVDGTPGAADMPGAIVFATTPDGTTSPQIALTIKNDKYAAFQDSIGVTTGIKIGATTAPATSIDIASGQNNFIRVAGFLGDPSISLVQGDLWYSTLQKNFRYYTPAGTINTSGVIYSAISDSTAIANTNAETNFNTSYTFPLNSAYNGKTIKITAAGVYSTILQPTIQFKVKLGTNVMIDFTALPACVVNSVTNRGFQIEAWIVCRTFGATGTFQATGNLRLNNQATTPVANAYLVVNSTTVTVDTSVAEVAQISAQWSLASPSNTVTMKTMVVEVLS